jgi:hypothetical protein
MSGYPWRALVRCARYAKSSLLQSHLTSTTLIDRGSVLWITDGDPPMTSKVTIAFPRLKDRPSAMEAM